MQIITSPRGNSRFAAVICAILLLPVLALAQEPSTPAPQKQPAVAAEQSQTRAQTTTQTPAQVPTDQPSAQPSSLTPRGQLAERDNPLLIGKRNINKGQIDFYSIDKEVALGRQMAAEIDRSAKFVSDPLVTEYVNRVGQNLALHSDIKMPLTIKVIDSNTVNAFTLPGGFLYLERGVIEAADNEAELAGVMAHEIGHAAARHGVEQASKGELANYLSIPLIFVGGMGGYIARQAIGLAVPLGFLKFSRADEKEADRLGAQYLWASGYDPHALITFFEKLEAKEKKKPGTIAKVFSTHPMTSDRIKEVEGLVARFPEQNEYQLSTSEFNQMKSRMVSLTPHAAPGSGDPGKPTLKRRPSSTQGDPSDQGSSSDRPTLKRGGNTDPATTDPDSSTSPTTSPTSSTTERPTLKRQPDPSQP
jgi:beta-barrel assembly-enhancing protease